jgi:sarcosine oxidase subunit beta
LRSIEIFSQWKELYGDDIEWVKGGYCFVAYREREEQTLKDLLKIQQSYGLNIEWLPSDTLIEQVPGLNREGLLGGTVSPEDGNASPLLTVHAYYDHARRMGAEFRFNEPVTQIMIENGQVRGVKTTKGQYFAKTIINAAGSAARRVGLMAGMDVPVTPDCHEAAITEPVARFLNPMVVDIRPGPGSSNFYFYQHVTGQIVFCITPNPNIWGESIEETSEFLPLVAPRLLSVMPKLMNIRVRRTWRGLYPMTPDGNPIVGWSKEVEGYLAAVGMCGQGFMLGPGMAELIARTVLGTNTLSDIEILSILSPYRQFGGKEKLQ